jgi:hypothetical protein
MLFKCPCGFANYIDALPANQRLTCEGCRKTWVVSKKGRKRKKHVHIVEIALAVAFTLIPATWPLSPMLLAAVILRLVLLNKRHKPWIRTALTVLTPIILALIAAVAFGIVVEIGRAMAARGHGGGSGQYADACLVLSAFLQQWTVAGLVVFGVFVAAALANQFLPKSKYENRFEKGQQIALRTLLGLAAIGLLVFFAQGSISNLAARAEARLEDRYLTALRHNERTKRCIALLGGVNTALQTGVRPEDKDAFGKALASESSAADAVAVAQRYLRVQGLASGPASATQPNAEPDEGFGLLWQAWNLTQLRTEKLATAKQEADETILADKLANAVAGVTETASSSLEISSTDHAKPIGAYFGGMVDFVVDHFPAKQVELRQSDIATAICSPWAAHQLLVRETVSKLYQQAVAGETLETWQPSSKANPNSLANKTITIRNASSQAVRFWAVGPNVKEASIPAGAKQDIALDKGTYQAVLSVDGATPTVLDLGYGTGHLSGEFTSQKAWIPDTDSDSGS